MPTSSLSTRQQALSGICRLGTLKRAGHPCRQCPFTSRRLTVSLDSLVARTETKNLWPTRPWLLVNLCRLHTGSNLRSLDGDYAILGQQRSSNAWVPKLLHQMEPRKGACSMAEPSPAETPSSSIDYEVLLSTLAQAPELKPLLDLHWTKFAKFVEYLFMCAGYTPEDVGNQFFPNGVGVDYNLYADAEKQVLVSRVEVRRYKPDNPLGSDPVFAFAGKLAGERARGIPGFLVTTGTFTGPAYHAEQEHRNLVTLIDGQHLLRYIAYVYGSRSPQSDGRLRTPTLLPPTWLRQADQVCRPKLAHTRVLTVGNNKGGVAKTVTARELGIGLAKRDKRVLLLDLDGQGTLSLSLPPPSSPPPRKTAKGKKAHEEPLERPAGAAYGDLARYFASATNPPEERVKLATLVRPTVFERLWLVAAGQTVQSEHGSMVRSSLHRMDTGGSAHPADELAFVQAIADVAQHGAPDGRPYDWIILDTPNAQSRYTRAALAAAHEVLVCVSVEVFAAQGVNGLLDTADAMRALMGTGTAITGAVVTRFPSRPKAALRDEQLKLVNTLARQGVRVLVEVPPDDKVDVAIRDAVKGGLIGKVKSLFSSPDSPATQTYNALIDQLLQEATDGNSTTQ